MKKYLPAIFSVCLLLTACSASHAGLTFDEGFQTFHYQGKDYAITKEEVALDNISETKERFMEFPVVEVVDGAKETVALNNLYQTEQGEMAVGVQDSFYKVQEEGEVAEVDHIHYEEINRNVENTEE